MKFRYVVKIMMIAIFAFTLSNDVFASNTGSASFDSSLTQYFNNTSVTELNFGTGDFTVECWFKTNSNTTRQGIVDTRVSVSGQNEGLWFFLSASGTLVAATRDNTPTQGDGTGTTVFEVDTWYHIAMVRSSGIVNVYINANSTSELTFTSSQNIDVSTQAIYVGSEVLGSWPFDGEIDEIRFWNVAKSVTEIAEDYQKELTLPQNNLIFYSMFNGDSVDSSVNANNLTSINSASFSTDVPFVESIVYNNMAEIDGDVISIAGISDLNANSKPEKLNLGVDASGTPTVMVVDVDTEVHLKSIQFFSNEYIPTQVFTIDDMSDPLDGIEDVCVSAVEIVTGNHYVEIKDSADGSLIKNNLIK